MEPDRKYPQGPEAADATGLQAKQQLLAFFTDNTTPLLGTLRSYVLRMGLARHEDVASVALEVLQEVVVEALDHVNRFDPTRQPMAWLLGIAMNVIKRKKVEQAKRSQRELTFAHLTMMRPDPLEEHELLDQIMPCALISPETDVEANEQVDFLLSLVSPEDQQIVRLAVLSDFERDALANELGISPVAARVRLHRALKRLRLAWNEQCLQQQQQEKAEAFERKKR